MHQVAQILRSTTLPRKPVNVIARPSPSTKLRSGTGRGSSNRENANLDSAVGAAVSAERSGEDTECLACQTHPDASAPNARQLIPATKQLTSDKGHEGERGTQTYRTRGES